MENIDLKHEACIMSFNFDKSRLADVTSQDISNVLGKAGLVSLSWSQHPAGEGMLEFEAKKKSQGKSLHSSMLACAFVSSFLHSLLL